MIITERNGFNNSQVVDFEPEESDEEETDEQRQARIKRNKANLLQWVTEADFAQEFNMVKIANHPFMLEDEEET